MYYWLYLLNVVQVCGILEFMLILRTVSDTLITEACFACPYRDVTDYIVVVCERKKGNKTREKLIYRTKKESLYDNKSYA